MFRAEKILCTFLSFIEPPFEGHKVSCTKKIVQQNSKKEQLKAYISQNKNKLARFINSEGSFQVHDLVHDFWERSHEAAHARSFSMVVQTCRQKSQQTRHTKKLCTRISKIHEQVHPYRRKEFQNILKRKLCSCFGQLFSNTYLLRKC